MGMGLVFMKGQDYISLFMFSTLFQAEKFFGRIEYISNQILKEY